MIITCGCVHSHGDIYEGNWVADRRHRHAILHSVDGTHYDVRVCCPKCCVCMRMCTLINVLLTGAVEQ